MDTNRSCFDELTAEILQVTMIIQRDHPILYDHLTETPLVPSLTGKNIEISDLRQYLDTITLQLATSAAAQHLGHV